MRFNAFQVDKLDIIINCVSCVLKLHGFRQEFYEGLQMRDYKRIDSYLNILAKDIYPQPPDDEHTSLAKEIIDICMPYIGCESVLDIGAGQGMGEAMFKAHFVNNYEGIALGSDVEEAQKLGRNVKEMDFHFLEYPDDSFQLVFARHVLEHSPMPLLALMEWHRVSSLYLLLVLPAPEHYGYIGRNHYSVMGKQQAKWLLRRAGWHVVAKGYTDTEYRFLCEKLPVLGYEGFAKIPLSTQLYEEDRDA